MQIISRRGVLIAGLLLPIGFLRGGRKEYCESLLAVHFGPSIAGHPETRRFLDAYAESVWRVEPLHLRTARDIYFNYEADRIRLFPALNSMVEEQVISAFLTSTNVLAALSGKQPLEFSGLFEPYTGACRNRLASSS